MGSPNSKPTAHPTPKPTEKAETWSPTITPTPGPTCQIPEAGVPQLKVTVAADEESGTADDVHARILTGSNLKESSWSDWALLNHEGCDNLQASATDYFNTFEDYSDPWLAIAIYNCGDDGAIIDGVGYWDGSGESEINYFCATDAEKEAGCAYDEVKSVGKCKEKGTKSRPADYFSVDQGECGRMVFLTYETTTSGEPVATALTREKLDPGSPECAALKSMNSKNSNFSALNTLLLPSVASQNIMIAMFLMIMLLVVYRFFKKTNKKDGYESLPQEIDALDAQKDRESYTFA